MSRMPAPHPPEFRRRARRPPPRASAVRESADAGDAPPQPALTDAAFDEADHHDDEHDHPGQNNEDRDAQLPVRPPLVDVRADPQPYHAAVPDLGGADGAGL